MLRIRLRRTGRKNRPHYRIVVAEHTAPLTGKFVDQLGHFDPRTKELGVNEARLTKWLSVGAQPSNRVSKLLIKAGIRHKLIRVTQRAARAPKHPVEPSGAKPTTPAAAKADEPTTAVPAADAESANEASPTEALASPAAE